jgi:competence protein ComEC
MNKVKINIVIFLYCILFLPIPVNSMNFDEVIEMDLVVHFIDVGLGDAIFIECPDRDHEIVVDGGDIRRGYNFIDYIRPLVEDPIELAVITHPDYDHWSGIERLFKIFKVDHLWDPGYNRDCRFTGSKAEEKKSRDTYLKFINNLPEECKQFRPAKIDPVNPAFEIDEVKFWVLYSSEKPAGPDCAYIINNASIVIKMKYKDVSFIFTGDGNGLDRKEASTEDPKYVESNLLNLETQYPGILHVDVLKVPHHGSTTASSIKFIKTVAPRFAVISSSSTSHYHLPSYRVIRRYQRVRWENSGKIEKVLRTNFREKDFENREFGDDHIICATNGEKDDLICDYIWNFEAEEE